MSQVDFVSSLLHQCPAFEGNADFYGAGIRIGIYLQWVSAWLSNTLNPAAAASNHDANAIFLLAVLIALTIALANGSLHIVEAYVMLLLSSGFVFTVLSFLGLRLYFLQPSTLATFLRGLSSVFEQTRKDQVPLSFDSATTAIGVVKGLHSWLETYLLQLSLNAASGVKHPALSWSGVVLRAAIGSFIAALNIWLWFGSLARKTKGAGNECDRTVFFFGQHEVKDSLLLFFKVSSIMLAVPVFYLFLACIAFASRMILLAKDWFARQAVITLMERINQGKWDNLSKEEKTMLGMFLSGSTTQSMMSMNNPGMGSKSMFTAYSSLLQEVRETMKGQNRNSSQAIQPQQQIGVNSSDKIESSFWTVNANELPPLSELLQGFTSLWSRGVEIEENEAAESTPAGRLESLLCTAMHVITLVMIACFIAFIELSISASNITGVHNVNTTGQLIPFVIGIASFIAALREVLMMYLRKKYPQWHQFSIALKLGMFADSMDVIRAQETQQAPNH